MHPRIVLARERLRLVLRVMRLRPFETETEEGRSLERYRRIVLGTASSIIGRGITTAVSLVSIPLMLGFLGKSQYGFWVAVNALLPWVGLADLGIGTGLVNPIAEAHGRDDHERARAYFSTALFLLSGIGVALLVLGAVTLPFVPWSTVFSVPPTLSPTTVRACVALAFAVTVIGLPLATATQVYVGFQKSYVAVVFPTIGSILSLALLLGVVRTGGSVVAVFAAVGGGTALGAAAGLAFLVLREMPWLRPSFTSISRAAIRRLLATSVPLYLFQFGALLVNQSQQFVLVQRAGLSTVAEYDLLVKVYVMASTLVTFTTSSVGPSFRESWERGEHRWMRRTFWHLVKLRMAMAAGGSALLVLGGDLALRLWLRRTDFQYGRWSWALLAVLIVTAVWASTFAEFLTILDRIWPQIGVVLCQGLATVVLTWVLAGRFGLIGALVAYTAPAVLLSGVLLPRIARGFLSERTAPGATEPTRT